MKEAIHPTLTKENLESLGFNQAYWRKDNETGGTWSIRFTKPLNDNIHDELEMQWFNGTQRYSIMRHTENLKNIFLFEGFLNSIEDLKFLISLFDLSKFCDLKDDHSRPFLVKRSF